MRGFKYLEFTPTIDTNIYADGDQLGPAATKMTNIVSESGLILLSSLAVVDKSKQKPPFEILFWESLPTVASADNAAISVTAAESVKCIGRLVVANTIYRDVTSASVGAMYNINHLLKAKVGTANPDGKSLWFTLVSTGTPTFTSTTSLLLKMGFEV